MAACRCSGQPVDSGFTVDFADFTPPDLVGQASWIADSAGDNSPFLQTVGTSQAATILDSFTGANLPNPTPSFDPTLPWILTATAFYTPTGADAGGDLWLQITNVVGLALDTILSFSAGAGALNQVSDIEIDDTITFTDNGPWPFPSSTDVEVQLAYDGSDLITRINGVERTRLVGAVTTGATPGITFRGHCNSPLDVIGIRTLTLEQ